MSEESIFKQKIDSLNDAGKEIKSLRIQLSSRQKELASLKDWQNTILNCPPETRQLAVQRMADGEAMAPIIQSWKNALEDKDKELAEAKLRDLYT